MEPFSLLIYWKAAGNTPASVTLPKSSPLPPPPARPANIDDLESDDEGPFFDVELTLPKESSGDDTNEFEDDDDEVNENKELKFNTISAEDSDIPLKPKPQFALSLLKSATRLSVFKPDLRKANYPAPEPNALPKQSKFSTKSKVKEAPMASLFDSAAVSITSEDKTSTNSKEFVQKYLRKIKPLYVRVLKNKAEEPVEKTRENSQKHAMSARLRLVCGRLGKCKSSSSAMAAVSSPQRRDDSLLMQQDGIQSAIAHCKRSFKEVSKGKESSL